MKFVAYSLTDGNTTIVNDKKVFRASPCDINFFLMADAKLVKNL